jgi:hypothetical protein
MTKQSLKDLLESLGLKVISLKPSPESAFGPRDSSSTTSDPAMNQFVADSWDIIDELGNLLI